MDGASETRASPVPVSRLVGRAVGPYTVTGLLGRGGGGEVLEARDERLARRVALKTVPGHRFGDAEVRRRFRREARILSRLSHPNICGIHDLLETADGEFLVLELIEGRTLTELLGEPGRTLRERLGWALQVLDALVAAHKEGIVHRDLKPGNVMVTPEGAVKVLDFGLARSLAAGLDPAGAADAALGVEGSPEVPEPARLAESFTRRTLSGGLLGTPRYMSPEQARGEPAGPPSDLYSFGLVLREILAGRRLREGASNLEEIFRNAVTATVPKVEGPAGLVALADELAALDETRRPSATEARRRLERWLDRPRRWLLASAAGVFAATLLAGALGITLALRAAREASVEARREAAAAEAVSDFLVGLFEASDVEKATTPVGPDQVTARDLLSRAADLTAESPLDPGVRARVDLALGRAWANLGVPEIGERHLREALEIAQAGPAARLRADLHYQLGHLLYRRARHGEARQHLETALALREEEAARGLETSAARAVALRVLAGVDVREARFDQAGRRFEEARLLAEGSGSADVLAGVLNDLAIYHFTRQRWAEAELAFRESLELRAPGGPGRWDRALALDNLGAAVASQGRLDEAAPLFEEALAIRRSLVPGAHPVVARSLNNLGKLAQDRALLPEAESLHREALAMRMEVLGREHPATGWSFENLTEVLLGQGRAAEALDLARQGLASRRSSLGSGHPEIVRSILQVGRVLEALGREAEAIEVYREGRRVGAETGSGDDRALELDEMYVWLALYPARLLDRGGDRDAARALAAEAERQVAAIEADFGGELPSDLVAARAVSWLLQGRDEDATELLARLEGPRGRANWLLGPAREPPG